MDRQMVTVAVREIIAGMSNIGARILPWRRLSLASAATDRLTWSKTEQLQSMDSCSGIFKEDSGVPTNCISIGA